RGFGFVFNDASHRDENTETSSKTRPTYEHNLHENEAALPSPSARQVSKSKENVIWLGAYKRHWPLCDCLSESRCADFMY
ncbi:MAG: hypothetical protein OXE84_09150, partial [Rhodobacteraceae bacterium]|nr:hypothetical protein [Paracoccaceae bacterium]